MTNQMELILELESANMTRALCCAVEPDNRTAPEGVRVTTFQENTRLISTIETTKKLQTLLATFNDLIVALITVFDVLESI